MKKRAKLSGSKGTKRIINWPKPLVLDIARRRSVIFLGSGISKQARNSHGVAPKTWAEFLDAAISRCDLKDQSAIQSLVLKHDYLTACQVAKEILGPSEFGTLVKDEFLVPGFRSAPIHDVIIGLESKIVATPNFDKIFDNRINHSLNSSVVVKNYYDPDVAEAIRCPERLVIKVHGTIDTPSQMIFTRQEYAVARQSYKGFYAILDALVLTYTFLFVGCGLDDPDIRLVLETYAFQHNVVRPHYFVLPLGMHDKVVRCLEDSMNVKFLFYDSVNDHQLLKKALEELIVDVSIARAELLKTGNW